VTTGSDAQTGGSGAGGRLRNYQARARQNRAPGRYSNFVGVMRYGLPAVAVLLLALVMAWPLMTGREEGFRISFSEDAEIDSTLKMVKARYVGTDEKNQPFTITAEEAFQPDRDSPIVHLSAIEADIFVDEGSAEWLALTANEGLYQRDSRLLDLAGDVTVYSDAGHEFHTNTAHVDLRTGIAEGHEPMTGQGPHGLLNAGSFKLKERGQVMQFGDRVRMIVFPSVREQDDANE
jgi:lipopolysaccharide export system protein LptC